MTNNNDNICAEIMTNHVVYKVSYSLMKCIDCTLFLVLQALQDHQLSDFPNNTPLQVFPNNTPLQVFPNNTPLQIVWRGSLWNWCHSLKITQQKKYLMKKSRQTTMTTILLKQECWKWTLTRLWKLSYLVEKYFSSAHPALAPRGGQLTSLDTSFMRCFGFFQT